MENVAFVGVSCIRENERSDGVLPFVGGSSRLGVGGGGGGEKRGVWSGGSVMRK